MYPAHIEVGERKFRRLQHETHTHGARTGDQRVSPWHGVAPTNEAPAERSKIFVWPMALSAKLHVTFVRFEKRLSPASGHAHSSCLLATMLSRALLAALIVVFGAAVPAHSQCSGNVALAATGVAQTFADGSAAAANYGNNLHCSWTIVAPEDQRVRLTFTRLALEAWEPIMPWGLLPDGSSSSCLSDWVQLYDGSSTNAASLGRFCGTNIPSGQTSTGTTLHVVFRTDSSVTDTGFEASYVIGACARAVLCVGLPHQ